MANTIKVIDKIAAVSAEIFVESCYIARNSMRSLEDEFQGAQKIGNTVRVRKPSRYEVNSDTFANGVTTYSRGTRNAIAQSQLTLTCDQSKWIGFDLTSEELSVFSGDDAKAMKELLEQPIANLSRQVDTYCFGQMALKGMGRHAIITEASGFTIDDASTINAYLSSQIAGGDMSDRKLALSPKDVSKAQISAKGLFQNASDIAEQYKKGIIATGQGFSEWFDTASLTTITIGTLASDMAATNNVTVSANYVSGATSLVLAATNSTFNGKTLKQYQAIEIENVYRIDPQTLTAIPEKATIVIQADTSVATADQTITCTVVPMYVKTANITDANVSALPLQNAKVTILENKDGSNSGKLARIAVGWKKSAIALATIKLPDNLPGAEAKSEMADGVDIRVIRQYNKDTNATTTIADMQFGFLPVRPEWIASAAGYKV